MSSQEKAKAFLTIAPQFKLGSLITESFHPKTQELSKLVKKDVKKALKLLEEVDHDMINLLYDKNESLWKLALDIQDTLSKGHKVFMCGCGATGRLSLVLETLFHQKFGHSNQVISFMAGGDFALIKSVESFEDKTEYGEKQLLELGFGPDDLLLASSEGGETPFVIGAALKAAEISKRHPYFLYCNPNDVLMPIERSRNIIESSRVKKVNLTVGPMAISGSTRMQASTALMLGIGIGLLYRYKHQTEFNECYRNLLNKLKTVSYDQMGPFTSLEAKLYQEEKHLNYLTDSYFGMTILTDTTERSPTFSLAGFENQLDKNPPPALSYLFLPEAMDSSSAWKKLLWRSPRPLSWEELNNRINLDKVLGFDISRNGLEKRTKTLETVPFNIFYEAGVVNINFKNEELHFHWGDDVLFNHLMLKMILNAHSTSIMGLLGRYEGNVMTWVRASNNKLIDRAARYIQQILFQRKKKATYEEVVLKIFQEIETIKENEPIVLKVVDRF